ncbi:hypothetical protein [uncultured Roseibium sp.]|uniref:hypothetical protein n=1 Tax=uncultured Roseibium sp. TaxID=1936171 RepID=UPI002591DC51|nr:hypothetical protein [uncultured Roseibium sp.]
MYQDLLFGFDFEKLPSDPTRRFILLEQHCRRELMSVLSNESPDEVNSFIRTQYMSIVASLADELNINEIVYIDEFNSIEKDFQEFMRITSGVIARLRLRTISSKDQFSVRISNRSRGIIEDKIDKIRKAINDSDLSTSKKKRLLGKLEAFRTELHRDRMRFANALGALSIVAAGIVGTASLLADAPDAIETIFRLVGEEKEKEDAEVMRLEGPKDPLLLEKSTGPQSSSNDDEIPF